MANYEAPTGSSQKVSGMGERVGHIGDSASQLYSEATGAVKDLGDMIDLRGRMERNPLGTLALAVGVGYVLGGGLFTNLTGRIFGLGMRLAALPLIRGELAGMAESALDGFASSSRQSQTRSSNPMGSQGV